jgi:ribosomal protein L37AE/L43A
MVKISCPKCEVKKVYLLSKGKRNCSLCKYKFTPHRLPPYLTRDQWGRSADGSFWNRAVRTSHYGPVLNGKEF